MTILANSRFHSVLKSPMIVAMLWVQTNGGAEADTLSIFRDQNAFLANAPVVSTETFNEFPAFASFPPPQVTFDQVTYTTASCNDGSPCWILNTCPSNCLIATAIDTRVFSFGLGRFVNALGFHFVLAASSTFPSAFYEMTVSQIDGDDVSLLLGPFQVGPALYFGLLSSSGISQVSISPVEAGFGRFNWYYDDVSRSDIRSVPEPSVILLVATSSIMFAGLAASRRRKLNRSPQSRYRLERAG